MVLKNKILTTIVGIAVMACLSACTSKSAPDEFMVLKKAPLVLPPDFHLTPDGPDSDLDEVVDPQAIARRALFGEN